MAALGLLAYSNTFDASFHLDDHHSIGTNPTLKDPASFIEPSKAERLMGGLYPSFKNRFIGYLTFAVNYRLHGLDVLGYHLTNLAIHFLNGLLLYSLVLLNGLLLYSLVLFTFSTPKMEGSRLKDQLRLVALFAASLFVLHPIQTQAVTYIVQRFASLATMFYLGSMVFYVKWRLRNTKYQNSNIKIKVNMKFRNLYFPFLNFNFFLSLLFAILAMKTKQIAFTLPLAVVLYEFMFFHDTIKRRALRLLPFLLTLLIIPSTFLFLDNPPGYLVGDVTNLQQNSTFHGLNTSLRNSGL
jgi:hypothetical protein